MLFILPSKIITYPLGEVCRGEQTMGFSYSPLDMNPLGFDGVEPGTLDGKRTLDDAHSDPIEFDLSVVLADPLVKGGDKLGLPSFW